MTPLEELQAAHKRLSELRTMTNPDKPHRDAWRFVSSRDGYVEIGNHYGDIVSSWGDCSSLPVAEKPAELIVTLHRTIDAQLRLLELGIARIRDGIESRHGGAYQAAFDLATAINGEAS